MASVFSKKQFRINTRKNKSKLQKFQFFHKITVILSFVKDMNSEFMIIPIEMQQMENGCILYDLHKTICITAISKNVAKNTWVYAR